MDDEEILDRLTSVRGVGPWTVEMLLIFTLGRKDVLPATDYGVRKGFALTYGWRDLPTPKQLLEQGEKWRPHRTTAAWYLWRSLELPSRTSKS
jgi:3-methyladenine DNA glycosylase/8-oxoguanine DNA glycosylase